MNGGGISGTLGDFSRVYIAMRWDLAACPANDWFSAPSGGNSSAQEYLGGSGVEADCVAGLTAALDGCNSKSSLFLARYRACSRCE